MALLQDSVPFPEFNAALILLRQVKASFDLAVYDEFLDLLGSFYRGERSDSRAVHARLFAIIESHPDLARRLGAFLRDPFQHEAVPVRDDPPKRPKRERRHPPAASVDPDCAGAMRFLERVKQADAGLYDRVLALLFHVGTEVTLDANQIYDEAREIFGSAHRHLLRGFTEYLPTGRDFLRRRPKKEPPEQRRAPAPKRKGPAAAIPDDAAGKKKRKTTSRRASPAAVDASKGDDKFAKFREAWEFETAYTNLVVTMRRTKKALEELKPKPKKKSREEAEPPEEVKPSAGHHVRPRTFEELYPGRECREVLQEMYGDKLEPMREALEDGARTELALRTIQRRLKKLEQVAVQMTRERRDPARVEGRMYKLAVDRVVHLPGQREAASNPVGPCESLAGMSETKIVLDQDCR
ncbi:uncharacterized protein LOC123404129 [Hordeum vulgare subsp. vulgare]|uniref:Histone deacetylase interacting domain-containing protein n=1 Tax=Hordeum vulgare subsp. vulgare TaxID=112509 RepID=A0A8I6Y7G7_HORVV|nr:uncharacterized protein LOC123404129 [Hordeum vulgare subsp. vulgare]